MKKRLLAAVLSVAMVATMFSGCGANTGDSGSSASKGDGTKTEVSASTPAGTSEDGAITINISSEPADLCSATTTDSVSITVLRHVMEPLVGRDENDAPTEGLGCAESYEISDDGLTYTFKIREGMKWSNGEPVTANDFVFGWTTLLAPETASEYSYIAYFIKNAEAFNTGKASAEDLGVKALDDYTLEVTLEQPTAYALDVFTFASMLPINQKAYEEITADGSTYGTDKDKIVTNGAFNISDWTHEDKIVLEKNDDYYKADDVELSKINMVMIEDTNAILSSYEAGELDMGGVTAEQVSLLESEGVQTYTYDDGSCWYLEMNMKDGSDLANADLRKAIAYGIDADSFVKNIIQNDSKVATGFVPPAVTGLEKSFTEEVGTTFSGYDLDKAKEYLEKAKSELGKDKIELTMICDTGDTAEKYAAFVQDQMKNVGIDLTVNAMEFKSRLEAMTNKDFDIVFAGWSPDYNDPLTFLDLWVTGGGNNHTSFSNAEYDDLIKKAQVENDATTRMNYLYDAEKLLMQELPIAPIYNRSRDYVVSAKLDPSTVVRTAFQDIDVRFAKLN